MKMYSHNVSGPDEYPGAFDGWRRKLVVQLRGAVRSVGGLEEVIKYGHLMYLANGPVGYIRAEDHLVYFGFWRGQRLRDVEPRLKPGGKYEMATITLLEGDTIDSKVARKLVREAVALNRRLGDPTKVTKLRK